MRGKLAKKLRKYSKRNYIEYLKAEKAWPFRARWRLAWWLLFGPKLGQKRGSRRR